MNVESNETPVSSIKRPKVVTLLIVGVLSIAVLNFIRSIYGFSYRQILEDLLPFSPYLIGLVGIFWGILMAVCAWGLLQRRRWAPGFTQWISVGYLVYLWLDNRLFRHPDNRNTNLIFPGIVSLAVLLFVFFALRNRATKEYFGETNERPRA